MAFKREIELIKLYKEQGVKLCNLTNGGEGVSGLKRVFTKEHKDKLRQAKLANPVRYWKGKKFSKKHTDNLSKSLKGKQNKNKGRTIEEIYGEEEALKIRLRNKIIQTGKKYSKEVNKKKGRSGQDHWRYKLKKEKENGQTGGTD